MRPAPSTVVHPSEFLGDHPEPSLQLFVVRLSRRLNAFRVAALFGEPTGTVILAASHRVDALLRFLADFYGSYQMRALVEMEPGLVLGQLARALPALVELIAPELQGQVSDPQLVATTLVRLSVCHYLVPASDDDRLIDQLRAAAGVR